MNNIERKKLKLKNKEDVISIIHEDRLYLFTVEITQIERIKLNKAIVHTKVSRYEQSWCSGGSYFDPKSIEPYGDLV